MRHKIQDLIKSPEEFTMDEFWAIIDALPDEMNGKKYKTNVNAFFHKDGTPKDKQLQKDEDYQDLHDIHVFISHQVKAQLHLNKLKNLRETSKQHIKDIRNGKSKRTRRLKKAIDSGTFPITFSDNVEK